MLSDNLAPIISPHPGKVLPGAVLPVYPMLESLSRKSDGIKHGSVRRRNYTVLEPLRASRGPLARRSHLRESGSRALRALSARSHNIFSRSLEGGALSQHLLREGEG